MSQAEFGHKKLTTSNWLQPDPVSSVFVRVIPAEGRAEKLSADDWAKAFLSLHLSTKVPGEVRALFNVARGACLYGYFYYPMYTLGMEQMYRVGEAAITHKCGELELPTKASLARKIQRLVALNVLNEREAEGWGILRRLRNWASHPQQPSVVPPGQVLQQIRRLIRQVDALY